MEKILLEINGKNKGNTFMIRFYIHKIMIIIFNKVGFFDWLNKHKMGIVIKSHNKKPFIHEWQ
jgi:hypothetical protein